MSTDFTAVNLALIQANPIENLDEHREELEGILKYEDTDE